MRTNPVTQLDPILRPIKMHFYVTSVGGFLFARRAYRHSVQQKSPQWIFAKRTISDSWLVQFFFIIFIWRSFFIHVLVEADSCMEFTLHVKFYLFFWNLYECYYKLSLYLWTVWKLKWNRSDWESFRLWSVNQDIFFESSHPISARSIRNRQEQNSKRQKSFHQMLPFYSQIMQIVFVFGVWGGLWAKHFYYTIRHNTSHSHAKLFTFWARIGFDATFAIQMSMLRSFLERH